MRVLIVVNIWSHIFEDQNLVYSNLPERSSHFSKLTKDQIKMSVIDNAEFPNILLILIDILMSFRICRIRCSIVCQQKCMIWSLCNFVFRHQALVHITQLSLPCTKTRALTTVWQAEMLCQGTPPRNQDQELTPQKTYVTQLLPLR